MDINALAIIVAAGNSERAGFDKLQALIDRRTVIEHSIAAFHNAQSIKHIILVTTAEKIPLYTKICSANAWHKITHIVPGGSQRHLSVIAGLDANTDNADKNQIIAVHDGARPLVQPDTIDALIAAAKQYGAAAMAHPIVDTIKRVDPKGIVRESINRDGVWAMETPQAAKRAWLDQALRHPPADNPSPTDEVSALQAINKPVHILPNPLPNPKITYPSDLALAEAIFSTYFMF